MHLMFCVARKQQVEQTLSEVTQLHLSAILRSEPRAHALQQAQMGKAQILPL